VNLANLHFREAAGEDSELVGLGMNARRGPTATSPLPQRAACAGFSLNKPGAGMVEDGSCEG
jgi:hypothetical protein